MSQSQPPKRTNYRQKGKIISGKIVKGFVQEATSKISTGTIPSKFETIIYKTNNQQAFGVSNVRFFEHENERPGPGQYRGDSSIKTLDNSKVDSKKGYGNGFASQLIRNPFGNTHINSGPGPGSYTKLEQQKLLESRTQNFKGSSTFLTYGRDTRTSDIPKVNLLQPGPGEYEPKDQVQDNTYKSSFVTKTKRDQWIGRSETPAPTAYNIKRNLINTKNYSRIGAQSVFCLPTEKKQQTKNHMQKLVQYLDSGTNKENLTKVSPGPGDYNNEPPVLLPEYLKTQPNMVFKEGLKDRFGDFYDPSREKQLLPCPQKYHKEDIIGMNKLQNEKALVCGSAFMSESERKPYGDFKKRQGPNSVIPYLSANKKSYHLNLSRKFV